MSDDKSNEGDLSQLVFPPRKKMRRRRRARAVPEKRVPAKRSRIRKLKRASGNLVLRPHPLSEIDNMILFFVVSLASWMLTQRYSSLVIYSLELSMAGIEVSVHLSVLYLASLYLLAVIAFNLYDEKYIVSEDGVMEIDGVISFSLRKIQLNYQNIRATEVEQSLVERYFGIGSLLLGTAVNSLGEITMHGIKRPERYKRIIEKRIKERQLIPFNIQSVD